MQARRGRSVRQRLAARRNGSGGRAASRRDAGAAADVGHGQVDGRMDAATGTTRLNGQTGACCRYGSGMGARADGGTARRTGTRCKHGQAVRAHGACCRRGCADGRACDIAVAAAAGGVVGKRGHPTTTSHSI